MDIDVLRKALRALSTTKAGCCHFAMPLESREAMGEQIGGAPEGFCFTFGEGPLWFEGEQGRSVREYRIGEMKVCWCSVGVGVFQVFVAKGWSHAWARRAGNGAWR